MVDSHLHWEPTINIACVCLTEMFAPDLSNMGGYMRVELEDD